tara:strand:+ start:7348 stop:7599 length:252 start_codon:yes stop_codon:yes gene_type:complete
MNFILWIFIGLSLIALWLWFAADKRNEDRIAKEMEHAREQISPEFYAELEALLYQGRKMEAIKRLREKTGIGLFAAKRVVETL